jgi:hypothetical protein
MRGGIERWFFMLSYVVLIFWLTFFNAGQLISAIVSACCCYHCGEKRLVNCITFLLLWQRLWWREHGGSGQLNGGGSILAELQFL